MSRNKTRELRSAFHQALEMLPKTDRSRVAERERDLVGEANCALWDSRMYKISACLRRLMKIPGRGEVYTKIWESFAI